MEDVLDVYQRAYDPKRPLICFDETRKELHNSLYASLPARAGRIAYEDYSYQRNGTASLLLWYEPLSGRRGVQVEEHHTYVELAGLLKHLCDELYPEAERVVLVCDNLSTHHPACLYERFTPEEAHRLSQKLEWHYTPEHGSWLNVAECELSVLSRQCLSRRLSDQDQLEQEVRVWERERNGLQVRVDWQFTTADARVKLKRLYPKVEHKD